MGSLLFNLCLNGCEDGAAGYSRGTVNRAVWEQHSKSQEIDIEAIGKAASYLANTFAPHSQLFFVAFLAFPSVPFHPSNSSLSAGV